MSSRAMVPSCQSFWPKWPSRFAAGSYTEGIVKTLDQSCAATMAAKAGAPPAAEAKSLRVAYLLSQYPAISHTFFLQEVLGLRARGMHIETASINRADRPLDKLPAQEAAESLTTYYVKHGSRIGTARLLLGTVFTRPDVALRGLRAILRLRGLTTRQRCLWLMYLAEALLIGRWMKLRHLNHLHVHFGGSVASVGMLLSAAWQMPYSLTIHGPEELLDVAAYHLREKLDHASFVLCVSEFCRSELCQIVPASSWGKFHVHRLGVDPSLLTPSQRKPDPLRSGSGILELVCVGRLVAAKGHQILLQALVLLQNRGVQLHATLIGGGPERHSLEAFARERLPQGAVVFASALSHPETLELLRKADIFALASFAEGIPVALMEAMSLGLPCVSTHIAGIPELIQSGRDGLLVAPGDAKALADALFELAHDPALRKRLGCSARQRVLTEYNLPLNQESLARTLTDLIPHANVGKTAGSMPPALNPREQGSPR